MNSRDRDPICTVCGMQYESLQDDKHCAICDDPRQFVPQEGQSWTTLAELRPKHRNVFKQDQVDSRIWSIYSEPKIAIGQRAILLETPHGNILWDMISLVDQETADFINSRGNGGLVAIVISHPHSYGTNAVWSAVFQCPVYIAKDDKEWLFSRPSDPSLVKFLENVNQEIAPGITVIKCGGHFPGSLCLHWEKTLFVSDTLFTVASSRNPDQHQFEGVTGSFGFVWSVPGMIPLDPQAILQIWTRLKPFKFEVTFGNIPGTDVKHKDVKRRLLQSAKIQLKHMGWEGRSEQGDAAELIVRETL